MNKDIKEMKLAKKIESLMEGFDFEKIKKEMEKSDKASLEIKDRMKKHLTPAEMKQSPVEWSEEKIKAVYQDKAGEWLKLKKEADKKKSFKTPDKVIKTNKDKELPSEIVSAKYSLVGNPSVSNKGDIWTLKSDSSKVEIDLKNKTYKIESSKSDDKETLYFAFARKFGFKEK